jgi:hypothetical protein
MADLRRGGLDGRGGRLEIRYGQKIQVTGIAHPIPSWCHSTLEKCGGASTDTYRNCQASSIIMR